MKGNIEQREEKRCLLPLYIKSAPRAFQFPPSQILLLGGLPTHPVLRYEYFLIVFAISNIPPAIKASDIQITTILIILNLNSNQRYAVNHSTSNRVNKAALSHARPKPT